MKKEKMKAYKIVILIIFIAIFVFAIYQLAPIFKQLSSVEGRQSFSENMLNLSWKGYLIVAGLAFCKTILVFLPAEVIELLAGMSYGPLLGLVTVFVGYGIGTLLIAIAVKKYGESFVDYFVAEDKQEKIKKEIKENPKRLEAVIFILYFLPVIPKDFITYVGNLLPIPVKRFLLISLLARIPATLSSTIVGSRILSGDIKTIVIVYISTYLLSLVIIGINSRIKKAGKKEEKDENIVKEKTNNKIN